MRPAAWTILFTLLAIVRANGQQMLFSTFGPGESFSAEPGLSLGAGEYWNLTGNNGSISAAAFTPSATMPFSHADFALAYAVIPSKNLTGLPNIDVTLTADDGGQPGNTLETIHVTNALGGSTTPAVLTVTSLLQPMLQEGVQYWLVLQPPDLLQTFFNWVLGPASAPNRLSASQFLSLNTGTEPWWSAGIFPGGDPAFAVFGAIDATGAAPAVAANGIVSAASYSAPVSTGSWIAIFGTGLAQSARGWEASDFHGSTLPISLDGVSVLVNGVSAAVSYVSPGQVNALFPDTAPGGFPLTLQVVTPKGASVPVTLPSNYFTPALFTSVQSGVTYAAATHADGTPISLAAPAKPGETVALYGTGFGPANPAVSSETIVSIPEPLTASSWLTMSIGGLNAPITYAGITEAGLDQINVTVPALPPGSYVIEVGQESTTFENGIVLPVGAA